MHRGDSLLRTVMEGKMLGKKTKGRPRQTMLDSMRADGYENLKEETLKREEWRRHALETAYTRGQKELRRRSDFLSFLLFFLSPSISLYITLPISLCLSLALSRFHTHPRTHPLSLLSVSLCFLYLSLSDSFALVFNNRPHILLSICEVLFLHC